MKTQTLFKKVFLALSVPVMLLSLATGVVVLTLPATAFAGTPGALCAVTNADGSKNPVLNPDGSKGYYQADGQTCCPHYPSSATRCFYEKYVNPLIALLSALVGIAVVASIIYGAIEYITSGGDPQRAAAGQKRIVESLIGLAAFILLYTFLVFIVPGGFLNG